MKEESHNPGTGQELEARIVALVLGEASDFERDELNRLIEERPELAAFKEQIQSVHGLLRDAETGESLTDDGDWKLSAEKRSAVLAVIVGDAEKQSAKQTLNKLADDRRSAKRNSFRTLSRIAAVVCFVVLPGSMAILALFNYRSIDSAQSRQLASNAEYAGDIDDTSEALWGEGPASSRDWYLMNGANTTAADTGNPATARPAADADFDSEKSSRSALGAIRGTLDFDASASMPNDDEGPSVTIGLDSQGPPAADLNLRFDTGYFRATPSFDGFDAGSAPTEAVNGPESSPQQPAGYPALVVKEEAEWSGELNGDDDRLTDSQPTVRNAGNGELSFPRFTTRSGELNAFDPEEPVRSTISVPDGGTVLLGGIKRFAGGRGEPTDSSPVTPEYAESGGESQDAATDRDRALGFDNRPVLGKRPVSSEGSVADGESLGGGAGTGPADARRNEISAEHKAQGVSQWESGVWRGTRELDERAPSQPMTAPSQPMVAGPGGGTETADGGVFFDTKISDTARLANSIRSPTNQPTGSTEDLKSNGRRAVADRYEEELAKESVSIRLSDDGITLSNSRTLGQDESSDPQMSVPVTGTATVQPRGREAGWAKQDNEWGVRKVPEGDSGQDGQYFGTSPSVRSREMEETDQPASVTSAGVPHGIKTRVKSSLGEISAQIERKKNTNGAGDLEHAAGKGVFSADIQYGFVRQRDQSPIAGESLWYRYLPPTLENNSESQRKSPVKRSAAPAGLNEKTAEGEAFSTFSLHVSDVSFKLALAALAHGEWPEAARVRIEEFVNAFDYGDPMPSQSEKVACCLEQSIHPFLQQRNLLRVSMRTAAAGRSSNTPLRLTFLLDNSGSMERIDRQQTVRRAFALLAQQLKPIDQVTLISFARQPRLLADKVSGAQLHQLVQLTHNLPSEGGTNIEAALELAFEKAQEQQLDDAQNRIILLTDGAVNLGDANPESLSRMITTMRNAGIAFDAAGISAEGLNDDLLEALTRKGDGRYYLLDSLEAADDGFARQIAGALRPSAKNVKVQIEFNPKRVGRYKLLGFEKHRLKQEDFRNDKVDAAEMAAAEAGVAVYQFEAKPDGEGDVGSVSVRFRDLSTGQMIENRWPIPYEANAPRPDQAAPSLRIATSAALLAAKLRGEPLGETVDLKTLSDLIAGLPDRDRNSNRVQQLQLMIQQARQMSGK